MGLNSIRKEEGFTGNSIISKRMKHGNWCPFLPRGSLCNASGSFEPKLLQMVMMYKAILVSKGYSQFHGVYYTDTFAPVGKMDSIRLVLVISASKGWQVHHIYVKSALLHGEI